MSSNIIPLDAFARRKAALLRARREAAVRLLSWRQERGLCQLEAAAELGASVRVYGEWERGASKMPAEVLVIVEASGRKAA